MSSDYFTDQALDYADECIRDADSAFGTMALELAYSKERESLRRETQDRVTWALTNAWRIIISLLQERGQGFLTESALKEYGEFESNPVKAEINSEGEPFLVSAAHAWRWAEVLRRFYVKTKTPPLPVAVREIAEIIRRAETYLVDLKVFGWRPTEEADVHDRLESVLGCVFEDMERKPVIGKPIKDYIPDTGIPSKRALLEYKYITDALAGKRVLDEILADISAYTSDKYDHFIFVIYETDRVFPERRWTDHIAANNVGEHVQIILLKGSLPTEEDKKMAKQAKERLRKKTDSVKVLRASQQGSEASSAEPDLPAPVEAQSGEDESSPQRPSSA